MSSDQTYKHEREQAARAAERERLKRFLEFSTVKKLIVVEVLIPFENYEAALFETEGRIRSIRGVLSAAVI